MAKKQAVIEGYTVVEPGQAPPNFPVTVPRPVYDALVSLEPRIDLDSPRAVITALKADKQKEAAAWVEAHELIYGQGYFNGFIPEDGTGEVFCPYDNGGAK